MSDRRKLISRLDEFVTFLERERDDCGGAKQGEWFTAMIGSMIPGDLREALSALSALAGSSPAPSEWNLIAHLERQREFSERTFGPGHRTQGVIDHIRKELTEIESEPLDLSEWVDVILLALDGAWRAGHSPLAIAQGIASKQAKNEQRTWPDWRTADPGKAITHVKSASPAPEPETTQNVCYAEGGCLNHVACTVTNECIEKPALQQLLDQVSPLPVIPEARARIIQAGTNWCAHTHGHSGEKASLAAAREALIIARSEMTRMDLDDDGILAELLTALSHGDSG